ncbi:MAG: RNA methyltransferase [Planctomycetes bacterium]|nr:RNA methyltransferase [Planctomycetota bacterium]MBM4057572.1 RNA methyltransferase [Planctomycetota bacterium]
MKKPRPRRPGPAPHPPRAGRPPQPAGRAGKPRGPVAGKRHRGRDEEMFHGLRACEAILARRPAAIVRAYLTEPRRRQFAKLIEWCVAERKGFQIVGGESLERLTKSIHHEGVAILATAVPRWTLDDLLAHVAAATRPGPLVYLDGVQNPHNLGSILRTAAHFGATAILGAQGELPPLSPAAVRVAEGAAEFVAVCDLGDPVGDLKRLAKAGFRIVATSSHRGRPLADTRLGGKTVIVLGSEGEGVTRPIEVLAHECGQIPGTGAVESLNVGVACGVALAEAWRQRS